MKSSSAWGRDIFVGVTVTSEGRHGVGQPAVTGIVSRIERDTVIIARGDPQGIREFRRSIRNVRRVA